MAPGAPVPAAPEAQGLDARQAPEVSAAAAPAPLTEVIEPAAPVAPAPAAPTKAVHAAPPPVSSPAEPAKAPEAEPPLQSRAKVVEAPTVAPVAQVTAARALPATPEVVTRAPVADGGWLAPISEPGPHPEDIGRDDAGVSFDFDADLLPSAGEQPHNVPGPGSGESICTFWLGPDCFGLGVQLVSEVLLIDDILPVPWAPPALLGLINSRGRIVPVVSLAALLGASTSAAPQPLAAPRASSAILLEADSLLAAALVDRPGLVIEIDRARLIPTERASAEPWVKGHLRPQERSQPAITLLDPERLVQRLLDVSRFPDIRSCLANAGHGPARAASAKQRGVEIP
jgi:purine-binding chemotaxis protein CheW